MLILFQEIAELYKIFLEACIRAAIELGSLSAMIDLIRTNSRALQYSAVGTLWSYLEFRTSLLRS